MSFRNLMILQCTSAAVLALLSISNVQSFTQPPPSQSQSTAHERSNTEKARMILPFTTIQRNSIRLQAVADTPMPAEFQEKQEEEDDDDDDDESESDVDAWTATHGGFVPNLPSWESQKDTSSSSAADATVVAASTSTDTAIEKQDERTSPNKRFRNTTTRRRRNIRPTDLIQTIDTIQEYKTVVADEREKIVVVRFFASWCRSCRASTPLFHRMVGRYFAEDVKFVEVPLTQETAFLHEGLGVPSVPYGHIYHPNAGLVEEMKLSKKQIAKFEAALETYVIGSCELPEEDGELTQHDMEELFQ